MGFDLRRPGSDLLRGGLLAAAIGIPGLALYALAKALDLNTTVAPATHRGVVDPARARARRGRERGARRGRHGRIPLPPLGSGRLGHLAVIITSAVIRGCYHLYQGFGGFVGNLAMGLIFGWVYTRTRRVMPLVVAHTVLDVVAFVGYALLKDRLAWL